MKTNTLFEKINSIENSLYQTKNKSRQDPLNYPIKLNNKLAHLTSLAANGNFKPTDQLIQVKNELTLKIDDKINEWLSIKNNDLKKLNSDILNSKIDIISIK